MAIKILMPALSPTMKEGNLAKWLKKEGDSVEAGETIAEIETDKAIMEVEAVDEGVIAKIVVNSGTKNVKVNDVIAILAEKGETPEEAIKVTKELVNENEEKYNISQIKEKKVSTESEGSITKVEQEKKIDRIFASPLARRLASEENINLHSIEGSGPRGRIIKEDIELYMRQKEHQQSSQQFIREKDIEIPVKNIRQVIATRLVESKQQIPHFYLKIEYIVDKLLNFRAEINSLAKISEDKIPEYKISINDLLIKAVSLSLFKYPKLNCSWHGDKIIQYGNIDISVAVAIEDGLVTPIIKNANKKPILQISSEIKELIKKAKSQKLKPEEYQGGSFSISNLGMYSINSFYAIINPPQSCIMAVGGINTTPMYNKSGQLEAKKVMNISLSCDHRVIDGTTAAMFLNTLKEFIENPSLMICY